KNSIDTVSPEVKMLNTLQNQMYNIAEGLSKSSSKKGFGVGPVRLPNEVTQSAQDLLGRTLERSNTISTRVSSLPKTVGSTATSTLKRIPRGTGFTAAAFGVRSPLVSEGQPIQEEAYNIEGDYQNDYGAENVQDAQDKTMI